MPKRVRSMLVLLLAACLLLMVPSAGAETAPVDSDLADLRGFAPEGTFLAPGETPVLTEDSYISPDINIAISRTRDEESRSDIVIADVYVSSVAYLRRAFALDRYAGDLRSIKTIAGDSDAILAMTGDYATLLTAGLVVANGEVWRKTENRARDNCLILKDGRMLTFPRREVDVPAMLENGVWHSFLFGPALMENGEAIKEFDSTIRRANPRSVLGFYEPGHYAFVVVDGRTSANRGMTLEQMSAFMQQLGCQAAYNLDGGQSAMLWFNGEILNNPIKGGRRLKDIVIVAELPVGKAE